MRVQKGFTLIELLVVMVLIAALFSAVTISTGTNNANRELIEEGKRLQALFNEASQHAILYNKEVGWYFTEKEYGFLSFDYDNNLWSSLDQTMFRKRPINFELALSELDGVSISEQLNDLYKNPNKTEDKEAIAPSLVFLSSGEYSSFELALSLEEDPDWQIILKSNGFGQTELELPFDEESE